MSVPGYKVRRSFSSSIIKEGPSLTSGIRKTLYTSFTGFPKPITSFTPTTNGRGSNISSSFYRTGSSRTVSRILPGGLFFRVTVQAETETDSTKTIKEKVTEIPIDLTSKGSSF